MGSRLLPFLRHVSELSWEQGWRLGFAFEGCLGEYGGSLYNILKNPNVQFRNLSRQQLEFYRQSIRLQLAELEDLPGVHWIVDNIKEISLGRPELRSAINKERQHDPFTDKNLKRLVGLPNLQRLDLSHTGGELKPHLGYRRAELSLSHSGTT